MREGKWIGAKIGFVAAEPAGKANRGWLEADWFHVTNNKSCYLSYKDSPDLNV